MLAAGVEPELHAMTKMQIFVAACPPESLVGHGASPGSASFLSLYSYPALKMADS